MPTLIKSVFNYIVFYISGIQNFSISAGFFDNFTFSLKSKMAAMLVVNATCMKSEGVSSATSHNIYIILRRTRQAI